MMCLLAVLFVAVATAPLSAGDHLRTLEIDGAHRQYLAHVPTTAPPQDGYPVVLVFHGFFMNCKSMRDLTGMNEKSDQAGFVAVYPQGTGTGVVRVFNAGAFKGRLATALPDDVAMTARLIDDLAGVLPIDRNRVFAAGISNGGMMSYRLAAELSDRIAAVASVAGTMSRSLTAPPRSVPVLHIHGTADRVVPYNGPPAETSGSFDFGSVDETLRFWTRVNGCGESPHSIHPPDRHDDGTQVERDEYRTADGQTRVVLIRVEGGGHTWPGRDSPAFLGKSSNDISATDLIWEFFQQHPRGK